MNSELNLLSRDNGNIIINPVKYQKNNWDKIVLYPNAHVGNITHFNELTKLLNNHDFVFYEMFKWSSWNSLLSYSLSNVSKLMIESMNKYVLDSLNKLALDIKIKRPKITDQEIQKYIESYLDKHWKLVYQNWVIDYKNLSSNWIHSDLDMSNSLISDNFIMWCKLYSKFLILRLSFSVLWVEVVWKQIFASMWDHTDTVNNKFHEEREKKLFEKLETHEWIIWNKAILYWAWHAKSIDCYLRQKWYQFDWYQEWIQLMPYNIIDSVLNYLKYTTK